MKDKESRLFRSSVGTRRNKNGGNEDEGSARLASDQISKIIQKFLGLANYYQRFIEEFAKMVKPLHKLMRKEQKWN